MTATSLAELSKASIRRRQILPRRHAAGPRPAAPTGPVVPAVTAFAAGAGSLDPITTSWLGAELGNSRNPVCPASPITLIRLCGFSLPATPTLIRR
ncbi:hypothetical protein ACQP00_12675 [Dactylosporangium sp. CS-047395]|uniref:hypothetical protein n=1 Tax=Dactylosporangium sp. CS-047395 TaxID=3239936 RepID=UPI003D8D772B